MKKNIRIWIFLYAAILCLGIGGCLWVMSRPQGTWVEILQDGTVVERIDLSKAEDQTIQVEYEGRINEMKIENGRICVSRSDCRDHTCVAMGWLQSYLPIVCLPNHLVIQFADPGGEIDAIVQ